MGKWMIGVDLGGTRIKAALFDQAFEPVQELIHPTEAAYGPEHVLGRIFHAINELLTLAGGLPGDMLCIGLGIPGLLDRERGVSIFSPNLPGWEQIEVVRAIRTRFDVPVFIDNDVRMNMYGEWRFGAGQGYRNLLLVTVGTGLGSGIVSDGSVLYGTTSSAGEIGHMNMYREGRPCRCGSSGCLGRYVSAVGMVNTLIERMKEGGTSVIQQWVRGDVSQIEAQMLSLAYDEGDALAIEVMHDTGTLLGVGLANVINLLNPQRIIIGGGVSSAGDRLLNSVRESVNKRSLKLSGEACDIVQARLGSRAGTIGAAAYAYDQVRKLRQ
ncbi:ROK family protein [Paenibacillus chartarius]|uniref:ROK family protein n=1 Tax=Paenibacillus chartarius TaxID=747481 RepID=A0ABV6DPJ2_9BACL